MATQFSVRFAGPAVTEANAIDVSVFGSSLLALADLISEAQQVLDPDGPRYRIRVQTTGPGSFEVFLEMVEWLDAVTTLLTTREAQALAVLAALFGGRGLIGLLRWLRGRTPDDVQDTTFYLEGDEMTVERNVANLYSSRKVRRTLRQFVRPVHESEIEELSIRLSNQEPTVVTPEDQAALSGLIDDDIVTDETVSMRLRVEMIRWRSTRWEFREQAVGLFWANIEDDDFLRKVNERRVHFEKGDLLDCLVRVRQWDEGEAGKYRTEYSVISVLVHVQGDEGQQLIIPDQ